MEKTEIRNRFIERRNDLSPRQVRAMSARIGSRLKSMIDWPMVRSLHMYQSVPAWNEVQTTGLQQYIERSWPHIEVVVGDPRRRSELPNRRFDVILVPVLAFDPQLNRLGFGGGWYDRFLLIQTESVKIGLAYELQRADSLPVEPHDIRLDMVITERQIIKR